MMQTSPARVLPLQNTRHNLITFDNAGRTFGWFCLAHVLVWTLVPALMYHNPPKDSLEGVAWGQMWLFGYDKHPFLAPWLTAFVTRLFGTVGWPIYFLSQLSVVLTFWGVYRIALPVVGRQKALLSVLLLDGIYYYSVGAIPFNPNVAMLSTWVLAIWSFRAALLCPDTPRWALAGACAGLVTLAKYESGILFAVMMIVLGLLPEGRRALRTRAFYAGLAAAVVVVSPNLWWLAKHDFGPFHYALNSLNLERNVYTEPGAGATPHGLYPLLMFLLEQLGALVPMVLLYLPFMRWQNRDFTFRTFGRRFVFLMTCGPLLVTLVVAALTNAQLVARWGFPFFSLAGIALVLVFPPELDTLSWRRFLGIWLALLAVEVGGTYWVIFVRPVSTGIAPYSIAYPGQAVSDYVTNHWHEHVGVSLKYVAGDRWTIATISAFSKEKPIPYFEANAAQSPWLNETDLRTQGAVFVQPMVKPIDDELIAAMRARFPRLTHETIVTFRQHTDANVPSVRLWVAVLPPMEQIAGGGRAR